MVNRAGIMQKRIGDDLPNMKMDSCVLWSQGPQLEQLFEAIAARRLLQIVLQQVHHHIGGDQDLDGTCVAHEVF
jgi:hypothetical protein